MRLLLGYSDAIPVFINFIEWEVKLRKLWGEHWLSLRIAISTLCTFKQAQISDLEELFNNASLAVIIWSIKRAIFIQYGGSRS